MVKRWARRGFEFGDLGRGAWADGEIIGRRYLRGNGGSAWVLGLGLGTRGNGSLGTRGLPAKGVCRLASNACIRVLDGRRWPPEGDQCISAPLSGVAPKPVTQHNGARNVEGSKREYALGTFPPARHTHPTAPHPQNPPPLFLVPSSIPPSNTFNPSRTTRTPPHPHVKLSHVTPLYVSVPARKRKRKSTP